MRQLILLGFFLVSAGVGEGQMAPQLVSRGSTEIPALQHGTAGIWSHGAWIVLSDRFSSAPLFWMYDSVGNEISKIQFTVPGAARINIYDNAFARGSDGTLAVIGTAYTNDTRGTTFLAALSPDGQQEMVVRLSPFFPNAVTVASDGTFWVAGHQWEGNKPRDHSQNLIRRYDKSGKLLGSFMPWSTINDAPHTLPPDALSTLAASEGRVAWYSRLARTHIEFSLDGKVVRRVETPEVDNASVTSLAVCEDATFLGVSALATDKRKASWGIYELGGHESEWKYMPQEETWGYLHGCEANRVASRTSQTTILWLAKTE
ncbi:MAG TPA: hypothetical protein VI431_16265 [Candidatus Acidoferrum sp.]